ncbi:His-Xaa-Ser system radical SAM maturase HxsB [Sphingosinicella sp. CPCC 101087]|uniref:His-Xaa-Ser system radical SAM maturase HxsB n=1 Tax=Sphingosinicella sp. CPCC 101087 TaxID=2497754 RepID=UPI00101DAF52|nr:His-Xaa-Ser system radical SAM maturase HxsB [Sphingosinicella sp. CPCC 101087]
MIVLPLRVRPSGKESLLFANDAGQFFQGDRAFLRRYAFDELTAEDISFLSERGQAFDDIDSLGFASHLHGCARRITSPTTLDYLILVPTLRCNLACSYCQVSRASLESRGYDWSDETLAAVLTLIDRLDAGAVKLEFQGGEPTLRPDLIASVIERCERFADKSFVICTNLSCLDEDVMRIFDRPDVLISTSLDGSEFTHQQNRTATAEKTRTFFANLEFVLDRYGPDKVSALPTLDPLNPPQVETLVEAFASRRLPSIYLRPINYQGFARKRHPDSRAQDDRWREYYESFVQAIIARNWSDPSIVLEETYLSLCLRRIFQPGHDRHVDLRNPNPVGRDYIVIDHDGVVYPTDEARMLARSGVVDLAIGHVASGWDTEQRAVLDCASTNQFDPDCQRCTYQPFCGRDLVDDLARYGRIDVPRRETEFCRRHLHVFDFAFRLIYSDDPATRYSLARWLDLGGDLPDLAVSR